MGSGIVQVLRNVRQTLDHLRGRVPARHPAGRLPSAPPQPYSKLFIVGSPRSGTTWVSNIFAHHPQVVCTHESRLFEQVFDPLLGQDPRSPNAWAEILTRFDAMKRQNSVVGLHRYVRRPVFEQILDINWQRARGENNGDAARAAEFTAYQVLDAFFVANGGTPRHLLVEKTPMHVLHGDHLLRIFPQAKLLHVLRDGRDVCVSMESRAQGAGWDLTQRTRQIQLWKKCVEHGRRIVQATEFSARAAEIRYEQIKADPRLAIESLYTFANLDCAPRIIERAVRLTDFGRHRQIGEGQHNRKGVVGDWKSRFSAEELSLFRELAGNVFLQCGYQFEEDLASRRSA